MYFNFNTIQVGCCGGVLIHIAKPEYFILGKLKAVKLRRQTAPVTQRTPMTPMTVLENTKRIKKKQKKKEHRRKRKVQSVLKVREAKTMRLNEYWVWLF